jgi:hypothetical protein
VLGPADSAVGTIDLGPTHERIGWLLPMGDRRGPRCGGAVHLCRRPAGCRRCGPGVSTQSSEGAGAEAAHHDQYLEAEFAELFVRAGSPNYLRAISAGVEAGLFTMATSHLSDQVHAIRAPLDAQALRDLGRQQPRRKRRRRVPPVLGSNLM